MKKFKTVGKKGLGRFCNPNTSKGTSDDDSDDYNYSDDEISDGDPFLEGFEYEDDQDDGLEFLVNEYSIDQESYFPQPDSKRGSFHGGDEKSPPPPYTPPLDQSGQSGSSKQQPTLKSNFRDGLRLPGRSPRVFKILLLGGTGTGKSTIINTVTNYFLNGTPENPKVVIPTKYFKVTEKDFRERHSEAGISDVTRSKTTRCYTYKFAHPQNPAYKFAFIDTPGLSDTSGAAQDDKNIQEIINTAIRVSSLSAIVVIANGTEARVTSSIRNTLVRLANNLPDAIIDNNLLLILTKCGKASACFSVDDFAKEIARPKRVFYMDNQAFSNNPRIWRNNEQECQLVKFHWERSSQTIDDFLKTITKMSATSTKAFAIMKRLRDKIKTEIAKVSQDVANIQKVQDCLDAAQKALKETGDQKNSFSNYTRHEQITLRKFVPADYHSTVCIIHMRDSIICHERCGLEFTSQVGGSIFGGCACMGYDRRCKYCMCGPESHVHNKVRLVTETDSIYKVLESMRLQYELADQQQKKLSADANSYQSTLASLQAAADAKYQKIHKLCTHLSRVCSRFNFVNELHANLENMRQDASAIQNADMRKKAELEIKKLEDLANELSSK